MNAKNSHTLTKNDKHLTPKCQNISSDTSRHGVKVHFNVSWIWIEILVWRPMELLNPVKLQKSFPAFEDNGSGASLGAAVEVRVKES